MTPLKTAKPHTEISGAGLRNTEQLRGRLDLSNTPNGDKPQAPDDIRGRAVTGRERLLIRHAVNGPIAIALDHFSKTAAIG